MALHLLEGLKLTAVHKWDKKSPLKGAQQGDKDGQTVKIIDSWKNRLAVFETNFNQTLSETTSECKSMLRKLSTDLLNHLMNIEYQLKNDEPKAERGKYIEKWRNAIKSWKSKVIGMKCHQKEHLSSLIRRHCDFLMNMHQFHPEFVKWKISNLIQETNKIIVANDDAIRQTEENLLSRLASLFNVVEDEKLMDTTLEESDGQQHDAFNIHYDEMELVEEMKRRGDLIVDQIGELRADNTLTSLLEWLSKLRVAYTEPICSFTNYDPSNLRLESAIQHLEACKNTITGIAISFLDLVEPILREELISTKPQQAYELSFKRRFEIERWLECISFFEFSTNSSLKLVKVANQVWNQHVCRLETVKQLVSDNIRNLLIKQNQQQMKIEVKINTLLDNIREATSREEINNNIQSIEKLYKELIKIYHKTYEMGIEEADEFMVGLKHAKALFQAQATLHILIASDPSEYPQHGSELDVTLEPMTDLQHWEIIKQLFQSNGNWYIGLIEGMSLLCKAENDDLDELYLKGLKKQLGWFNELKEEAIERRKERLHTQLAVPRILELQQHENILKNHAKGLNKVFADRSEWEDDFKCNLLHMSDKLNRENDFILNCTNFYDNYHSFRFIGRITNFENEVKNVEIYKHTLLENTLLHIEKKYIWLLKANGGMLKYIRLFNEGGNFSPKEAIEFAEEINNLQSVIISEEKAAFDDVTFIVENIDPLRNVNVEPLSKIKSLINYKIRKNNVEDSANIIIDNLAKKIEGEIYSAKDVCSEICDLIKCNFDHDKMIQCLAGFASYLMYPHQETSFLECEDKDYMDDFVTMSNDKSESFVREDQECMTKTDSENIRMTCSELMEAAGLSELLPSRMEERRRSKLEKEKGGTWKRGMKGLSMEERGGGKTMEGDEREDGKSKTGKKGADKRLGLNKQRKGDAACIERKDVLRDTVCEQMKRLKALKEEKNGEDKVTQEPMREVQEINVRRSTAAESLDQKSRKTEKRKSSTKKKKPGAVKPKEHSERKDNLKSLALTMDNESMKPEEEEVEEEEETIAPNIEGDYLYKYTRLPKDRIVCTFLLHTKRIIYEQYLKIQNIAERFFVANVNKMKKKHLPKEMSPKKDFKNFTSQILKKLRILNIQCEHAWIILVHDYVCLLRAFQSIIDKRLEQKIDTFEKKWKHEFCRTLTNCDNTLTNAVVMKNRRAEDLVRRYEVSVPHGNANFEDVLNEFIQTHCDEHVSEIKSIWSEFSVDLGVKYTEFKEEVTKLLVHSKEVRSVLKDNRTIYTFTNVLKNVSMRFQKNLKDVIETNTTPWNNLLNRKYIEINKLKTLHFLFKVVYSILQDLEMTTGVKPSSHISADIQVFPEMTNPEKLNLQNKINTFLKNIVQHIKSKHGSFRKLCSDQVAITAKWLHHCKQETFKIKEIEIEKMKSQIKSTTYY